MTASPAEGRGLGCTTTYRAYSSDEVYEVVDTSRIQYAPGMAPAFKVGLFFLVRKSFYYIYFLGCSSQIKK